VGSKSLCSATVPPSVPLVVLKEAFAQRKETLLECGWETVSFDSCPLAEHDGGQNSVKQALLRALYDWEGTAQVRAFEAALTSKGRIVPGVLFPTSTSSPL